MAQVDLSIIRVCEVRCAEAQAPEVGAEEVRLHDCASNTPKSRGAGNGEHPWGVPLWVIALCIPIDVAGFVMLVWAHGF